MTGQIKHPADPLLWAHQFSPFCFDLSQRGAISVRDQIVRSYLVVRRMLETSLLTKGSQVLIVGAGASGVSAAIQCARFGAKTTVYERLGRPFAVQAEATGRWLSPTEGDFPLNYWGADKFPWWKVTGDSMPLEWSANRADQVAINWEDQFSREIKRLEPLLDIRFNTNFECLVNVRRTRKDGRPTIEVSRDGERTHETGDLLLLCQGPGAEDNSLGKYSGPAFWGFDNRRHSYSRVLISGGGDGALQDFVRLTTDKPTAGHVYRLLVPRREQVRIQDKLQAIEDQFQRIYCWNTELQDHQAFVELDAAHKALIADLLEKHPSVARQFAKIRAPREVTLAHHCTHFSRAYSINRFTALLILALSKGSGSCQILRGVHASRVESAVPAHRCNPARKPHECEDAPHKISFATHSCKAAQKVQVVPDPQEFDLVILRHGGASPDLVVKHRLSTGKLEKMRSPGLPRRYLFPHRP